MLSNTSAPATIKSLLLMALAIFVISCGEKDSEEVNDEIRYEPEIRVEGFPQLVYVKGSNTPYTGKMFGYLNEKKIMERSFKDGMVDGITTTWHENGQKESEVNYKEDMKDGLMVRWYENGQKESETEYDLHIVNGPSTEWHENGQKRKELVYYQGFTESWKEWNNQGELIDEGGVAPSDAPIQEAASETKPTEAVSVENPNLKYVIEGDAVTITGCDKKASGEIIIPAMIEGKPVTSLAQFFTFQFCTSLTNIIIPDSVTSIGNATFDRCTSLTSITIPDGVTSIGDAAFAGCTSLTSITIPDGVTSIGGAAFTECTNLTSITIPDRVTNIGHYAFLKSTNLTIVTFLGDAPKIENDAFEGSSPTIYREADAKGWGDTFAGRPVKLIAEKP